jgi:catechol 2,3-dioxygenase-like lactoylglutathione lyase family enzyme
MRIRHHGKRSSVAAGTLVTDIDHLQIAAPKGCEAQARHFFGDILGLAEIEKPESLRSRGGCWFGVGSRQLHIGVEEPFRPARKAHPAFSVSDIPAAFANLRNQGILCVWDKPVEGRRRFYARDPWGNRLEFTQPSASALRIRSRSRKQARGTSVGIARAREEGELGCAAKL